MGEYCDKAFGNMNLVQNTPDGTRVHYNFKDSHLVTHGTISRTEDFLDENLSLNQEDKFKILDFLKAELSQDYADYERHLQNKQASLLEMKRNLREDTEEKLSGAKKVSTMGLIGLVFAFAFSAFIGALYTIFSTYLPWHWPWICVTAAYILLWYSLYRLLEWKFNETAGDQMMTHGVLVISSYDIAIFLVLDQGGRLSWLAAVPFLIAIGLSISEK